MRSNRSNVLQCSFTNKKSLFTYLNEDFIYYWNIRGHWSAFFIFPGIFRFFEKRNYKRAYVLILAISGFIAKIGAVGFCTVKRLEQVLFYWNGWSRYYQMNEKKPIGYLSAKTQLRKRQIIFYSALLSNVVLIACFVIEFLHPAQTSLLLKTLFISSVLILLLAYFLYRYLTISETQEKRVERWLQEKEKKFELDQLRKKIAELEWKNLNSPKDVQNTVESDKVTQQKILTDSISAELNTKLTDEKFIEQIKSKIGPDFDLNERLTSIRKQHQFTTSRMNLEIQRLTRSANVNLVFGIVITLIAMVFLSYDVFNKELKFSVLTDVLSHYIPRISIVIIIEVFAFFFLRIYRTNLMDIKYFHNELTNIEMKLIALQSALSTGKEAVIEKVIVQTALTERNIILKKGESTSDLEREKIDGGTVKDMLSVIKELAGKVTK